MGGRVSKPWNTHAPPARNPLNCVSHFIVIVLPENSTRQTEKSLVVTRSCALTQTKTYPIQCCRHEMHISVMSVFIVVSLDVFTLNWLSGMLQPPTLCCTDITSETSRAHKTHTQSTICRFIDTASMSTYTEHHGKPLPALHYEY